MVVTNSFDKKPYSDHEVIHPNLELFPELYYDGYDFQLTEFNTIPELSQFNVEVHLYSGIILEDETDQIKLYD